MRSSPPLCSASAWGLGPCNAHINTESHARHVSSEFPHRVPKSHSKRTRHESLGTTIIQIVSGRRSAGAARVGMPASVGRPFDPNSSIQHNRRVAAPQLDRQLQFQSRDPRWLLSRDAGAKPGVGRNRRRRIFDTGCVAEQGSGTLICKRRPTSCGVHRQLSCGFTTCFTF